MKHICELHSGNQTSRINFASFPFPLLVLGALLLAGCADSIPSTDAGDPLSQYRICPWESNQGSTSETPCEQPVELFQMGTDHEKAGRCIVDEEGGGVRIEIYERDDGMLVLFGSLYDDLRSPDPPHGRITVKSDSFEFDELARVESPFSFSLEIGTRPTTVDVRVALRATEIAAWAPGPQPSTYETTYVPHPAGPWPALEVHTSDGTFWLNQGIISNGKITPINMSLHNETVAIETTVINVADMQGKWFISEPQPQEILVPFC